MQKSCAKERGKESAFAGGGVVGEMGQRGLLVSSRNLRFFGLGGFTILFNAL